MTRPDQNGRLVELPTEVPERPDLSPFARDWLGGREMFFAVASDEAPTVANLLGLSLTQWNLGDTQASRESAQRVTQLGNTDPTAINDVARTYALDLAGAGLSELAWRTLQCCDSTLDQEPTHRQAYTASVAGIIARAEGNHQLAYGFFRQADAAWQTAGQDGGGYSATVEFQENRYYMRSTALVLAQQAEANTVVSQPNFAQIL